MGSRVNLGNLAEDEVLDVPVSPVYGPVHPTTVPVEVVGINRHNPRTDPGDLTELIDSLKQRGQVQSCLVVTRSAYLGIYPEDDEEIGSVAYVICGGSRRRLAVPQAGIATLDIKVKDEVAATRESFMLAAIAENLERSDLDPLDEAAAVQAVVDITESYEEAGKLLSRSKGWVGQRIALLSLCPEMKTLLRSKELKIKDARRLASKPAGEQLAIFREEQAARTAVEEALKAPAVETEAAGAEPPVADVPAAEDEPPATVPPEEPEVGAGEKRVPEPRGEQKASGEKGTRVKKESAQKTAPSVDVLQALGETPEAIAKSLRELLSAPVLAALAKLLEPAV